MPEPDQAPELTLELAIAYAVAGAAFGTYLEACDRLGDALVALGRSNLASRLLGDAVQTGRTLEKVANGIPGVPEAVAASAQPEPAATDAAEGN